MLRANKSSFASRVAFSSSSSRFASDLASSIFPKWAAPKPRANREIASGQVKWSQSRSAGWRGTIDIASFQARRSRA